MYHQANMSKDIAEVTKIELKINQLIEIIETPVSVIVHG